MTTKKVAVLQVGAGIQRDGTEFASSAYIDGQWVRFQYGRPRKMGGYSGAFLNAPGVSRGVIVNSQNGQTWVISGFNNGLQQWIIGNNQAIGTGPGSIYLLGPITGMTVKTPGSGYTNGTYFSVAIVPTTGNGVSALATVVVNSGQVISVTATNGGNKYAYSDTFTIANASIGGTGTGFVGTISAIATYEPTANALWQFDIGYDPDGSGNYNLIAHDGQNLQYIDSQINTRVFYGAFTGNSLSPVGKFESVTSTTSGSTTVTLPFVDQAVGAGVSVSGTGIPAGTTVVSASLVSNVWTAVLSNAATASTHTGALISNVSCTGTAGQFSCSSSPGLAAGNAVAITGNLTGTATGITSASTNIPEIYFIIGSPTNTSFQLSRTTNGPPITTTAGTTTGLTFNVGAYLTFDNNISVSGGCVMLYPYLFVYGNYGLIQNCSAGNFHDWVSADANANNVASNKIVKGLPLRGGTTSPSGLFWSLDSVIRVSYAPQTVGTSTIYWKYDLITQQSSIMSSSCVIEYDGIYYWIGVDRFLMYNGVVQEIQNNQNMNWFFDGINLSQRQKVWASKVPRWGEIWWFYPRGNSTECNDAIIYNVREKCWYDAGLSDGATRSAGYFSDVFAKPIWAGNIQNSTNNYTMWVHESGTDQVFLNNVNAVNSYFETNVLGSAAGLVGNSQGAGENLWTRLDRVEPDFIQQGNMSMTVTGKGFADDVDIESLPYPFAPSTLKIDLKEQRRLMRLRFTSNAAGGNYFMGRVLLNIETGDVRGTGSP
jgi:hypothetical protein